MPAGVNEGIVDFENVEGMIDKCVVKLKNIFDRWRSYCLEDDLKEFKEILEYQDRIKAHVKLVLNSQGKICNCYKSELKTLIDFYTPCRLRNVKYVCIGSLIASLIGGFRPMLLNWTTLSGQL